MTIKSIPKRKPTTKKESKRLSKKVNSKTLDAHLFGSANFVFTTEEINAIKHAVKHSLMVEAENLEESSIIKTPALNRHLENDVSVLESVLTKLNFNE